MLTQHQCPQNLNKVNEMVNNLNANPEAKFSILDSGIPTEKLAELVKFADQHHQDLLLSNPNNEDTDDLKIYITDETLAKYLGEDAVKHLQELFGKHSETIIRRCQSHGKMIDFHTDHSFRTMQVALNDDTEFVGGRLMFASEGKLQAPARPKGTISIHDNTIAHGVTRLESGTRYGLFFLDQ